ncbi:peptidase M6 [Streptomyces gobiensis]|uniref:peptidase M6 n=1 Tax=Streptomyces gobiensis TaxID=2875706 RepID=UPI001E620939|nr:peptidase M6 [Streptomyces gobiensis]UGY90864.1 peptidase M6 [Streptomyces gobiensis]
MVCRMPARQALVVAVAAVLAGMGLHLLPAAPARAQSPARDITGRCAIAPEPRGWVGVGPYEGRYIKPEGQKKATMIMVDFPDIPARTPVAQRASFFADYSDDYLRQASYGKYQLRTEPTQEWIRLPLRWRAYGIDRGVSAAVMRRYVQDAITAAMARGTDFGSTDLVYVVADDNVPASPMVSQAHTFTGLMAGDREISAAALAFGRASDNPDWQRGNFVHEANHLYGLPDLYNAHNGASVEFAGAWDTMSMAGKSDLFGWHKWKLGWLTDDQVACVKKGTSEHELKAIGSPDGANIAVVKTGEFTAIVAEVRTKSGLDTGICSEGVLLYSVDSRVRTGQGPIRVVDATPNSGGGTECSRWRPSELAELWDAPFQPGARHRFGSGLTIEVSTDHRVKITKP